MGKQQVIIGISGHVVSDQRMKRIASALLEKNLDVTLYYRQYFKYQKIDTKIHFPFNTNAMKLWFNNGVLFYLNLNIYLFFRLLFKPCNYLYAVDSDTLLAFTLLSKIKGVPLIYDAHEYFCEVPELKHSKTKKSIWNWVTKFGVKQAIYCITVGKMLAVELEKRYGKPFMVVRNVPVSTDYPISEKFENPSIIYQGALNEGRQLELLIDAMASLPEFDCIIVGEGDLSVALRNRANDATNIHFKGLMTPDELMTITPKCFAGFNLLDAQGSLSYHFSLSNKYFDYIHASIPSISSNLPEYMTLNAENGCGVCIEDTQEALILTLKNWIQNPDIYQKFIENTNIAKGVYNWETEKNTLKAIF